MNDRTRLSPFVFGTVIAALGLGSVIAVARIMATAGLHVSLDPNEGWNAYHAMAAVSGGVLYPPASALMVNNYPPLSFYIVGIFGHVLGDNIVAGRLLSLAAFAVLVSGIVALSRAMGCTKGEAVFAALLFAANLLLFSDYVGMNDPQLMGQAFGITAMLVLLPEPRKNRTVMASALLFSLAFFVKNNLVVMPLAMTIWLLLYDRREGMRLAATFFILVLAGLTACRIFFGSDFLRELNAARSYSFAALMQGFGYWLRAGAIPLAGLGFLLFWRRQDKYVVLCTLYALVGVMAGAFFAGGAGVDVNAFFDAGIALALAAGLLLHHLGTSRPLAVCAAVLLYALPVIAGVAISQDIDWSDPAFWLHPLADEVNLARSDIAFLKGHQGPAFCETLALCYWAGKTPQVDVFNLGQQFVTGARGADSFVRLLNRKYFDAVEYDAMDPTAFTAPVRMALKSNYRVDHMNDEGVFLIPR